MSPYILQIHEFSRELIDITKKDGKFVSGGFGASEIANATHPVPDKIKQAVIRGDLRINDNYPPKEQEFALLAKEIDEYAILAVATREHDNYYRPLIAYRYFWLEKPQDKASEDIDGIGTLILWWDNSKQPQFNFQNNSNANNLQYNVDTCSKTELYTAFNQNFGTIFTEFIVEIKSSPYVVVKNFNDTNSYFQLHYLTLHLHREFKAPLSWAWNVGVLENPKHFTNIWVANQNTSFQIAKELKYQNSLEFQNTLINDLDKTKPENKLQNRFNTQPKLQLKNAPHKEDDLKKIILKAVNNNDESHFLQIILFINQYSIHDYDNDNIINTTTFNSTNHSHTPDKQAVIYRAILVYLGFYDLYKWAQWLNNIYSSEYQKISFQVQIILRNLSLSNQYSNAYQQLRDLMFHNYSNFFLQLSKINPDSEEYKYAEWLLSHSNSIWSYYLKRYTQNLVKGLISQDSNTFYPDNKLYQELISSMPNETSTQQRQKQNLYRYKSLAKLLKKLGNNSLSALLYQLSEGAVPKKIYSRADVEIIPLTREYTEHPIRKLRSFVSENKLLIISIICIFISLTGISWLVATKYFPQQQENTSNK